MVSINIKSVHNHSDRQNRLKVKDMGTVEMERALQIDKAPIKSFAFLNNFILIKKLLQRKSFLIQNRLHLQ